MSLNPSSDFRRLTLLVEEKLSEVLKRLASLERRIKKMPTLQEFKDALAEQNADITELLDAISDEVKQINDALSGSGNIPQDVLDTVKESNANIKAATDQVKGIIADPLPEPTP